MTFLRVLAFLFLTGLLATNPLSAQLRLIEINEKTGMETDQGKIVISPIYQNLGWPFKTDLFKEGIIGYKTNGLWGLMDSTGYRITQPIYSHLEYWGSGRIMVNQNLRARRENINGIVDPSGKVLIPLKYAELKNLGTSILAKKKTGIYLRYGIIGFNNSIILPFEYFIIKQFEADLYSIRNDVNKTGLYNLAQKRFLTDLTFDSLVVLKPNHFLAYSGGWAKLLHANGTWLLSEVKPRIVNTDSGIYYRDFVNWEIINSSNQTIKKLAFDQLEPFGKDYYLATQSGKQAFVDKDGKALSPYVDKIEIQPNQNFYKVFKDGFWGLMNLNGAYLIQPKFIDLRQEEGFIVVNDGRVWLIYNSEGKPISDQEYDDVGKASEGFIAVKKRGKWGFVDNNGDQIVPCIYEQVEAFNYRLSKVRFYGAMGLINTKGQWVLFPSFKSIEVLTANLFITRNATNEFAIQDSIKVYFKSAERLSLSGAVLIKSSSENKKGLCTWLGKEILSTVYDSISPLLNDSLRVVFQQNKMGVVNNKGKILIPLTTRFQSIHGFNEGLLAVKIDGNEGFVDLEAKLNIANRYEAVKVFQEGLAPIKIRGRWGMIDKKERIVIQPSFDEIEGFQNGLSLVEKENKIGLIDKSGKPSASIEYDSISRTFSGYFITYKNNKIGLLDASCKLMLTNKFDTLEDLGNTLFKVSKRGKFGVIDLNGLDIIPIIYDVLLPDIEPNQFLTLIRSGWKKL